MGQSSEKHILLVVAGISPAIISEVFYKLRVQEGIPLREVWIMTTAVGKTLVMDTLLAGEAHFAALCREYGIDRDAVRFDESTIIVARDEYDTALSDVQEDRENDVFPDRLVELVQQLTSDPRTVLHACLSGGRKSMSFYLGAALMMFGRKNDELVHVIIPRELELCQPKFYYPTRRKVIGRAEVNGQIYEQDYRHAEITISRIPYLKLRDKLPFPEQGLSYRTLVNLLQQHLDYLPDERVEAYPGLYPRSQNVQKILQRARQIPPGETVLITGESGTGKEVLARYLHNFFPGSHRPFKAVNLGAERTDLINAHLFGYRRGAFTGADRDTPGFFDAAGDGTLFLDEIDKLPLEAQPILLRVLQEKQYTPLGATEEKPVRCRILIATNRRLEILVKKGVFLEDLLYRIETFSLEIPPLRDRLADILPLARHFMTRYSQKYGKSFVDIDETLENFLLQHPWRGNVRQLESLIKKLVAMHDDFTLRYEFLDESLRGEAAVRQQPLERKIREFIEATLHDTAGNIKEAARLLGMNYTTLHSRLQKLGIDAARFRNR